MKHAKYGNVHPRTAPPFVVEHAGGINKEGMQFCRMYRDAADNVQAEYKGERPVLRILALGLVQQGVL